MTSNASNYHAYLLRLRREDEQAPWRAELVSAHTGDKHHFATETELYRFLAGLLASDKQQDPEQR
ncbi:hypothetical protein GC175_33995 [bacterium]|nr:hypothetical protein [bacterium]